MDILDAIRNNVGALSVGALWMIYILGDKVWKDNQDRKKTKNTDGVENSLMKSLTESREAATKQAETERTRADALSSKVSELSLQVGQLTAKLEYSEKGRTEAEEEVEEMKETVEALVIENRNKDKSISELVDLNRKLLRSVGSPLPVIPNEP